MKRISANWCVRVSLDTKAPAKNPLVEREMKKRSLVRLRVKRNMKKDKEETMTRKNPRVKIKVCSSIKPCSPLALSNPFLTIFCSNDQAQHPKNARPKTKKQQGQKQGKMPRR